MALSYNASGMDDQAAVTKETERFQELLQRAIFINFFSQRGSMSVYCSRLARMGHSPLFLI